MKESQLYSLFKNKFLEKEPSAFIYKIPDTAGLGGKKPFDTYVLTRGISFAIEFKIKGNKTTKYQDYQLNKFNSAGGYAISYIHGISSIESLVKTILHVTEKHHSNHMLKFFSFN
jgi:hypothetical protein